MNQRTYINFWRKIIQPQKYAEFKEINWEKPWRSVMTLYPFAYSVFFIRTILNKTSDTIFPYILILYAIPKPRETFIAISLLLIFTRILNWVANRYFLHIHDLTRRSIYLSYSKQILTKDPVYFSTHSSGKTLSVVERGREGVIKVIISVLHNWVGFLVSPIIAFIALSRIHWSIPVFSFFLMLVVGFISSYMTLYNNRVFLKASNEYNNQATQAMLQGITQTAYIRTLFQTKEHIENHTNLSRKSSQYQILKSRSWQLLTDFILMIMLILGILFIGYGVQKGIFQVNELFIAGMINLVMVYKGFWEIGMEVRDFLEARHNANEMFDYVKNFGKKTYPSYEDS